MMKANETKFQDLVASNYQYVVPLFQRPYSWTKREWQQLWEDILDLVENKSDHFIGSIVNIPTPSVPAGINKFLLIDGQQRMTTLFIVMMVLRDIAAGSDEALRDEINDMIVNRHKKGDDLFKLMPTQIDRGAYKSLVHGTDTPQLSSDDGGIQNCYRFFRTRLSSKDLQPIFAVISGKLSIVSIVLDPNDNPHVVFESLNAKGRSLSQSDLIRNFFFMRIHVDQHDEINSRFWQPLQNALGDNMTEFIRHYLMRTGAFVRQPDVYQVLKKRIEDEKTDALSFLKQLANFGTYYQRILLPEKYEANREIREQMTRLNTLQVTVAYPFLLNVYHAVNSGNLNTVQLIQILKTLENYVFRRAICGVPTYDLNKVFPALFGWIVNNDPLDFLTALQTELQKRKYPLDEDFLESLIHEPIYGTGERNTRTRFLLESIERSFGHKEVVDLRSSTIEHIMPQTPDHWWRQHLGKTLEETYETWLHSLGNLTLSGYNSEASNSAFPAKKKYYEDSNIQINKTIVEYEVWNQDTIEARAKHLAERALHIWPSFRPIDRNLTDEKGDVGGTKPYRVIILGQEKAVDSWADVLRETIKVICDLTPEHMDGLKEEFPTWLGEKPYKRSEQLSNGMYLNINWNPRSIYRACRRMIEYVGIDDDGWRVLWA